MPTVWTLALAALVGLAVDVVAQVVCCRHGLGLLRSMMAGLAAGAVATAGLTVWAGLAAELSAGDLSGAFLANLATYVALGYGYIHFLNLGQTARRVRLLRELVDAGEPLSRAELLKRYSAADIVRVRLARLEEGGQVVRRDGQLFIGKPTVLAMARAVGLVKQLTLGETMRFR